MKVKATFEINIDTDDFDPKFVDVEGLAIDLAKHELKRNLLYDYRANNDNLINVDDFEFEIVK